MATFFGEVKEIFSRSVWWSDSDDDNEDDTRDDFQEKDPKFSIDLIDPNWFETIANDCSELFISNAKHLKFNAKCLLKIQASLNGTSPPVCLATLNRFEDSKYWLAFDSKRFIPLSHWIVKFISFVFDGVLEKFKFKPDLIIVSKQLSDSSFVKFMKFPRSLSTSKFLDEFRQRYPSNELLAPETSSNEIELALMEHCIVHKANNFVYLVLSRNFDYEMFPKELLDSLKEFYDFSHYNLAT